MPTDAISLHQSAPNYTPFSVLNITAFLRPLHLTPIDAENGVDLCSVFTFITMPASVSLHINWHCAQHISIDLQIIT